MIFRATRAASGRPGLVRLEKTVSPSSAMPAEAPAAAPLPKPAIDPAEAEAGPSPFARLLRGLGREIDRGESMVRRATQGGGQELGNLELLTLQAGVYRYSEAVDLAAKLVDRTASGVKTVLQGQ